MSGQKRPSLNDASLREAYIAHLRAGMRRGAAAEFLGMRRFETYGYIAEHPDYEREVLEAEDAALENVEEALYNAAITGNVRAAELWLNMHGRGKAQKRPSGFQSAPPSSGSSAEPAVDDLEARLESLGG